VITNHKFAYIQNHFIHYLQTSKEIRTLKLRPASLSLPHFLYFYATIVNRWPGLGKNQDSFDCSI